MGKVLVLYSSTFAPFLWLVRLLCFYLRSIVAMFYTYPKLDSLGIGFRLLLRIKLGVEFGFKLRLDSSILKMTIFTSKYSRDCPHMFIESTST